MAAILVVDDDPIIRRFMTDLLELADFSVTTAQDGVEALETLREGVFDLMLLDIGMPRMDGLEVLARLKYDPSSPRVVVMTADDTPETLLNAVREQVYHYVNKKIKPSELLKLLKDILASSPEKLPIEVVSAKPNWVELLVPCQMEMAERIRGFMVHLEADLDEEVRDEIGMAFYELLVNAIEWGGKLDPDSKVRVAHLRFDRMLMYRIADPGEGFSFEGLTHAAVSNPEEPTKHLEVREEMNLRSGGFGVLMAQTHMDELLYNEAQNEVVLVKYLDSE